MTALKSLHKCHRTTVAVREGIWKVTFLQASSFNIAMQVLYFPTTVADSQLVSYLVLFHYFGIY